MMTKLFIRLAGLSGASSVGMAAYGAHKMSSVDETRRRIFENGNKLHMVHSVAMLACNKARMPTITAALFAGGTAIFSGSCYASALTGDRENGRFAPIGGTALIVAWLSCVL